MLTHFGDSAYFHNIIQIAFIVFELGCIFNGNKKFTRLIVLSPKYCEHIRFIANTIDDSFETKVMKFDVNT